MNVVGYKIPVTDIAVATDFYQKLGFEIVFESEEYGWASIKHGDFGMGLYVPGKGGGTRQPGGSIDFSLCIDNFEEFYVSLETAGLAISPIAESADGITLFDINDPDGNEITIRKNG